MGIGFKGGFAAFMDGYNKSEQQNYTRDRQAKEDAWLQSQRDAKLAEQKRDDELRTKLSELSPKATEQVDNFVMEADAQGVVPAVKTERTKTQAEQLDDMSGAYQSADPAKALELKSKADALRSEDYQNKFIQFRASAQNMPLKAQVDAARQIFNDAPNPGMIGEPVWGADGSVTFDAVNKATGQKVRKTFSDPTKLIDDIHSFISPKSYQSEMSARTKRAQELEDAQAKGLTDREKIVWQEGVKAQFRGQTVGGVGGGGSKKAPATPLDNALGAIDDNYKSDMDPDAISRARDLVTRSFQLDPSIDPQQRALAAKSAISNKATVSPRLVFGEKAGMAATHIDPTTGAKTPLHALPTQYAVTDADKAGFQADVKAFVAKENQTNPGFGDLMYQAAKGDKSAVAALPSFAAGRIKERLLAANPLPANLTAAQKVQALAALDARVQAALPKVMASIQPSLALIRTYGQ